MKKTLLILLCLVLLGGIILFISNRKDIELISDKVIANLSKTEKVIIQSGSDKQTVKTITNKEEIEELINIIAESDKESGWVTLEGNNRYIVMYDKDNKIIYTILGWSSGHVGFEKKEYRVRNEDLDQFLEIIDA